ncbi:arf-GAP domain and FG repeat-containing 1 isoform X1 [Pelobates cultripes]|uniref:Arf-GAP domain and FG repeat-containing 1 isoform X1 n=1 Tax=Pelobates cultripes TaxID=61616 RepID=A0AAD1RB95_PELCU|nr:arf-GAP domain and FG repeat-containing 1 isoform X1 [Pelobates cultripes]CAH2246564.1 arf-GAP domain and FG repeat-containing 1 isoform X1 [Pelobates cultripes]CAH2246565.1 arf-GAP domain and FG repeat-containing 1 isoform X1 [Pelobates cultripes]
MAASAKRKQEEKHLKLLREMTSLPHNRKCFDCDQRGPTYANMTAGAFVCTSCSGILRGLNPPHRVKSISMTTFTQQEIEFLQKHGNDACKQIWLGLFDDRSSSVPDFRDPQKMKEFLQEKYEKKRWYVPPEQARVVASVHASISGSSASSASSTPEVKPLKTLLGDSAPTLQLNKGTPSQSPVVSRNQPQQQHHQPLEKKPFDLLGDLGADIFATPAPQSAATANFANFANFNSHAAHNSTHADFANFDAFGQSSGTSNFGALPTSSQTPTPPLNTAFRTLSSSCSFGDFTSAFSLQATHRANANANFAQFDNFPKSSSADFGAFNSNAHSSVTSKTAGSKQSHPTADKYAALADLDSVLSSSQGGGQGSAYGSSTGPASSTQAVPAPTDNVFGIGSAMPAGRTHQPASAPGVFGVSASTNPFVSQSVGSAVNPFQSNGRVPQGVRDGHPAEMDYQGTPFHPFHPNRLPTAAGAVDVSSFGTASLSMPAGFGTQTAYSLPTSFSGSFHQPAFPAQTAFPQQTAFSQQPNGNIQGGGFAVFGQAKPMVTPFGQVAAPGVSSNPFMAGAPSGQFPAGSSSTNPFL